MKTLRTLLTCGVLLAAMALFSACATEKQVASSSRGLVEEPKQDTSWADFLGWLLYPTARSYSEMQSK
jgi:hypothetical protein